MSERACVRAIHTCCTSESPTARNTEGQRDERTDRGSRVAIAIIYLCTWAKMAVVSELRNIISNETFWVSLLMEELGSTRADG